MNNEISTSTINHFTKFDYLVGIIKSQSFKPHFCLENVDHINWRKIIEVTPQELETIPNFAYPMVCFTDLPRDKWEIHKKKYGDCVITMTEEWKIRNGLMPVIYLIHGSLVAENLLSRCLQFAWKYINNLPEDTPYKKGHANFIHLLLEYIKPYKDEKHNYYDEREWRFIPWHGFNENPMSLTEEQYNNQAYRDAANKRLIEDKKNILWFNFEDIVGVEVPSEDEREIILDVLSETFGVDIETARCKVMTSQNNE